jgi:hypothetical protein
MHPYTTDSNERKLVPLYIAILSILVAWIFFKVLEVVQVTLPWWIDAPSIFGFYGLFYAIFDKYSWKWELLQRIGIVKVPNLNGTWKGYLASSFDEHAEKRDATIKIFQSWTQISIVLETSNSKSVSLIAAVITRNPLAQVLSYEYLNEPIPDAKPTMHTHRGTARLTMQADGKKFEGEYYSGRDRQNFGIIRFERTSS